MYVTEALRLQGEGKYPSMRWVDFINTTPPPVDNRPATNIAAEIWDHIRGEG